MTIKKLTIFISIVLIAFLSTSLALGQSQGLSSASNIRSIDFRNVELRRISVDNIPYERPPARFTNGRLETTSFIYSLMRVAYGDLNGDGREEAALLIRGENKATMVVHDDIYIFS
jgi:hypothetical protein